MAFVALHYRFSQSFPFPASDVFRWVTDYRADDLGRMGVDGSRGVTRLGPQTFLLRDVYMGGDGRRTVKKKLIHTYPDRMTYTNTQLAGPNVNSQFFYQIVPEGGHACRLDYTGCEMTDLEDPSPRATAAAAKAARRADAALWKRLAKEIARDLSPRRSKAR